MSDLLPLHGIGLDLELAKRVPTYTLKLALSGDHSAYLSGPPWAIFTPHPYGPLERP